MSDAVAEAHQSTRPAPLRWWKEVIYAVAIYVIYSAVRNRFGSAGGNPQPAFDHAELVIDIQDAMYLYFEPTVQEWYLDLPARGLIRVWNVFYGVAHFVVTAVALIWLYRRDPDRYPRWRNTLAFMTLLALIGFATFSLMPPRLLDDPGEFGGCQVYAPEAAAAADSGALSAPGCDRFGFVDTVAAYGGWISFGDEGMKQVSNQYAAMPSMHIGWATWSALVLVPLLRRRWAKVLAAIYPVLTLVCIVVTGNHFWIDGVGGLLCLAGGYGLAVALTGRFSRQQPPAAMPQQR